MSARAWITWSFSRLLNPPSPPSSPQPATSASADSRAQNASVLPAYDLFRIDRANMKGVSLHMRAAIDVTGTGRQPGLPPALVRSPPDEPPGGEGPVRLQPRVELRRDRQSHAVRAVGGTRLAPAGPGGEPAGPGAGGGAERCGVRVVRVVAHVLARDAG